jgi:hypothetical protein
MIDPSSKPTVPELYAELRLVRRRSRYLKRACVAVLVLILAVAGQLLIGRGAQT